MSVKISKYDQPKTIRKEYKTSNKGNDRPGKWWRARSREDRAQMAVATANYLRTQQTYRFRQAGLFARMYGNTSLIGATGVANIPSASGPTATNRSRQNNRPTMNVIQSIIDTKVSRIGQSKPRPIFLTDNGDYKERNLSKKLNNFIVGELYRTKAYETGLMALRDAEILGTGCVKIFKGQDRKVQLERVLCTELLVDPNDALYGSPRQLFQVKLVDRDILREWYKSQPSTVNGADAAYPDESQDSSETIADQVLVVEAWHLKSGPDADDGLHIIATSAGPLLEEAYDCETFPFRFIHDSRRILGFWGQGAVERLRGTQVEINKMLITSSRATQLMGVPRVWLEDGSKVVKSHINDEVGTINTYRGTLPTFQEGNTGLDASFYQRLESLVQSAYSQEGVSEMAAQSKKPAGLDSGEALREYDDQQDGRLASLGRTWDQLFVDLAYAITDEAAEIAEEDGKYTTVFVDKRAGARQVELPDLKMLKSDYVIQVFDSSSLPRDPAGRNQKIVEYMQAGIFSMQEGRRLLDFPDIEQVEKLASSGEERILKILDEIVEDGKYSPPDPFMDPQLAAQLCTQYYNLYTAANLEQSKTQMLETFAEQVKALVQAAMPSPMPQGQAPQPGTQAVPEAQPTSPLMPQVG